MKAEHRPNIGQLKFGSNTSASLVWFKVESSNMSGRLAVTGTVGGMREVQKWDKAHVHRCFAAVDRSGAGILLRYNWSKSGNSLGAGVLLPYNRSKNGNSHACSSAKQFFH